MNDTLLTALIGLGGSLVGALAALGGSWLQAKETRKDQREQWDRETKQRERDQLLAAYFEFFEATHRFHAQLMQANALGTDAAAHALGERWVEQIPLMGSKVRLLEPCQTARDKTVGVVQTLSISVAKASFEDGGVLNRFAILNEPLKSLGEFEIWLTDVRFKPGYVPVTKSPSP